MRTSSSSAGMCHTDRRTPEETRRATIRDSAGFDTAMRQSGQRNAYDPWLFVEQTFTVTSRVVNSMSPQVGQLALMVAIRGLPNRTYEGPSADPRSQLSSSPLGMFEIWLPYPSSDAQG